MKRRFRIKNKKRFVTFLLLLFLLILCASSVTSAIAVNCAAEYQTITVKPGDTLWDIAGKYSGNTEIREYIYHIRRLNGLDNALIYAGQRLYLP